MQRGEVCFQGSVRAIIIQGLPNLINICTVEKKTTDPFYSLCRTDWEILQVLKLRLHLNRLLYVILLASKKTLSHRVA